MPPKKATLEVACAKPTDSRASFKSMDLTSQFSPTAFNNYDKCSTYFYPYTYTNDHNDKIGTITTYEQFSIRTAFQNVTCS